MDTHMTPIKFVDAPPPENFTDPGDIEQGLDDIANGGMDGLYGGNSSSNWDEITPMTGSHIPGVDTGARNGETTFLGGGGQVETIGSGMGSFGGGAPTGSTPYESALRDSLLAQLPAENNSQAPGNTTYTPWWAQPSTGPVGTGLDLMGDGLLAESPTAQAELQYFFSVGGTFQWAPQGSSSQTLLGAPDANQAPVIYISQAAQTAEQFASQVAHELGHFTEPTPPVSSPPLACYNSNLDTEGAATVNNIVIADEINTMNSGSGLPPVQVSSYDPADNVPRYEQIYNNAVQSGDWSDVDHQIGEIYGQREETGATPPESYRQFYSNACKVE